MGPNFVEATCDNVTFRKLYRLWISGSLARNRRAVCRILRSGLQRHTKDSGTASTKHNSRLGVVWSVFPSTSVVPPRYR